MLSWKLKDKEKFREMCNEWDIPKYEDTDMCFIKCARNIIGVGDYTCSLSLPFTHLIYDGITRHNINMIPVYIGKDDCVIRVPSPIGMITSESFETITSFYDGPTAQKRVHFKVDGEEDLLALLVMLTAPDNSIVLWGDPFENCTRWVRVTANLRVNVLDIMVKTGEFQ